MDRIDETLSGRKSHSLIAEMILLGLTREQYAEHYAGLRDYVRWLLSKRDRQDALAEFEARLTKSDTSLKEKVAVGEISEAQANQIKGDRIWWRAFEETRGASLYMAVGMILEKDLVAYFKNEPVNTTKMNCPRFVYQQPD